MIKRRPASRRLDNALRYLFPRLTHCQNQAAELLKQQRLPLFGQRYLFFFLGHIAKAEGTIGKADIHYAEALMAALSLNRRQRKRAVHWFTQGKTRGQLGPLKAWWLTMVTPLLAQRAVMLAICLCHSAQLHGRPSQARRYRCEDAIVQSGLPVGVSDDIFDHYAAQTWPPETTLPPAPKSYQDACEILGITRHDSLQEAKRIWRRKVSSIHPDKLAQQQLTHAELAAAKERLLRYQQAWEFIKQRHKPS
ncbi:molecular chaperone DjlA [Marinobacter psychrophilus]|jgi:DnaJ like chaperone protein|uniref:molecular chaperone DjlA n=1 Tax=Marinobacter psychrophilus TaxID=330734 RepID=UPI001B45AC9D|nr:molecular chaperone DjlA [Marinobacter psychrophilus]MBQ0764275.1 molecular chaperone DjlA [Marinobacter psychrophilus]MBQ0845055.1 molecular chaperone DjlA [Marinobacter psychrophilus]